MVALDWLIYVTLALVLGAVGQSIRVGVGLKKLSDKNAADREKTLIDSKRIWISVALGALAAVLTAIAKWDATRELFQADFIFALIAAGYAGSDIIEGLMNRAPMKTKTANT